MIVPTPTPSVGTTVARATPTSIDMAALAAHGIGRGDFAAIVFSGSTSLLGEAPGYGTWLASRKFAMPDPRVAAEHDLARDPNWPLPPWPADRVRPTPGVCFVFTDDGHPAVDALRARGAAEFEHFVVLPRLTLSALSRRRIDGFLAAAQDRPVAVLGYGDQGTRMVRVLQERRVPLERTLIVDDRPERQIAAANAGLCVASINDVTVRDCAVLSTPLLRSQTFSLVINGAARDGRPVLDNALPWDGHPEFITSGTVSRTGCAMRATTLDGTHLSVAENGLDLPLLMAQAGELAFGFRTAPALQSGLRQTFLANPRNRNPSIDLSRPLAVHPLAHRTRTIRRAFVHLEGQSNHQDAAFAIFTAREFLCEFFPEAASAVIAADHRGALGNTPFERAVVRTTTGRSLGSPYMTHCEQAALGVLARQACSSGAGAAPIIEIGSAIGGSTLLMAAATEGAVPAHGPTIHSIDPDTATRPAMRALFEHSGHSPRLRQIVKTSDAAIAELAHLVNQVGFIFIDGLHTRACSASDFALYAPLLRTGGLIAFHDCDIRHAGVFQTVSEIASSDTRFTLRCLVDTIAVFERTRD